MDRRRLWDTPNVRRSTGHDIPVDSPPRGKESIKMNGRTEGEQLSTSITKDVGINALRQARVTMEESMALASECIIAYQP